MVIERNENERASNSTQSKRSQIVEVTRSVEQEPRSEICFVLAIKLGNQTWRRGKAQPRPPRARINYRKTQRLVPPRLIPRENKSGAQQKVILGLPRNCR